MTDNQMDCIIRSWNLCDRKTKIRIAAEFFSILRSGELDGDWWQFLDQQLLTSTGNDFYCDT